MFYSLKPNSFGNNRSDFVPQCYGQGKRNHELFRDNAGQGNDHYGRVHRAAGQGNYFAGHIHGLAGHGNCLAGLVHKDYGQGNCSYFQRLNKLKVLWYWCFGIITDEWQLG